MDDFDFAPYDRMVAACLARWEIGPRATARVINHSENITYRIDDPDRAEPLILRLHRPGYHTDAAILSELHWLAALRADDVVRTAPALAGRDGELLQVLSGPGVDAPRRAVLFGFLDGREPEEGDMRGTMGQLGAVTARLHRHARAWSRPAGFQRQSWDMASMLGERPIWGHWHAAPGTTGEARALLARAVGTIGRRLGAFGDGAERRGLIHADLRAANLLVGGPEVAVIDFDDCGFGWYLYDYATTVTFMEENPEVPDWTAAWVAGYRGVMPLSAEEEAELPTFLLLRRMMAVCWIGSHMETELAQSLGARFVRASCDLAEGYLARFG